MRLLKTYPYCYKLLIFVSMVIALTCCHKNRPISTTPGSTLFIGEITTLTGAEASFGMSSHRGVLLAIHQINEAGGIHGKKVEVMTLDDRGNAEETATAATQLLSSGKIVAVTGALPSSRSMAMAPIAQKYRIPMVSSASTHPGVTLFGNFIFRTCFTDPFQGKVMAKFTLENLKLKKIAILKDIKSDYSIGLTDFFKQTFQKSGGQILLEQSYGTGDIDFKSQLTSIRAKSPEAIFVPGYYTEGALIARQAKELGIQVPFLGGDGWDSPRLVQLGGEAVEHFYYSTHYSPEDSSILVQKFVTEFKQTYGEVPDGLATLGYDAIWVLADALKRTQSYTPSEIQNALVHTREFIGVTGKLIFDENRNPIKSAVVMTIRGGKPRYTSTLSP